MKTKHAFASAVFGAVLMLAVAGVMVGILAETIDDASFALSQFPRAVVKAVPCGFIGAFFFYFALQRKTKK